MTTSLDNTRMRYALPTFATFPSRRNSLNAIRLCLAALVIVSHTWPIGGFGPDPQVGRFTLGTISVAGFFAISGWLITQSRLRLPLNGFLWRRALRIYPGYLAALLAVGFLFAPIGAAIAGTPYSLSDGATFVRANLLLLINQFSVGQTLPPSAYPAWDGAMWTLFSEAVCYVAIGVIVSLVARRHLTATVVTLGVVASVATMRSAGLSARLPWLPGWVFDFVSLAPFFCAGSALFLLRHRVPMHGGVATAAAVLLAVVFATSAPQPFGALPIAYLAMWLGSRRGLAKVGARHDLSYGVYLYGFPVQQLLALSGGSELGPAVYTAVSLVVTWPIAALSWLLVERPAQRLRPTKVPTTNLAARTGVPNRG